MKSLTIHVPEIVYHWVFSGRDDYHYSFSSSLAQENARKFLYRRTTLRPFPPLHLDIIYVRLKSVLLIKVWHFLVPTIGGIYRCTITKTRHSAKLSRRVPCSFFSFKLTDKVEFEISNYTISCIRIWGIRHFRLTKCRKAGNDLYDPFGARTLLWLHSHRL